MFFAAAPGSQAQFRISAALSLTDAVRLPETLAELYFLVSSTLIVKMWSNSCLQLTASGRVRALKLRKIFPRIFTK